MAAGHGIGERLRAARLAQGLSVTETAERAGITKGFLSQAERGLASLSVGSLLRLCGTLGIPAGKLLDGDSGPLVRAGERPRVQFGGQGVAEFRLTPASEGRLLVLQSDIAPGGGSGEDSYVLDSDVEYVHVLAGEIEVEVSGTGHRLAAGDSLTFDPRLPHRWTNLSTVMPARVLWVLAPGLH